MKLFLIDASYEKIYCVCDTCSDKAVLCSFSDACSDQNCHNSLSFRGTGILGIFLLCVNSTGKRVVLRDQRFVPFANVSKKGATLSSVKAELRSFGGKVMAEKASSQASPMRGGPNITYFRIKARCDNSLGSAIRKLESSGFTVYEEGISPKDRYLSQMNLRLGSWVDFEVSIVSKNVSNCEEEYIVMSAQIIDDDNIPSPSVLSFDIECQSQNENAFPDPYDSKAFVSMIGIVYDRGNGLERFCLSYTKTKFSLDDTEVRIFDTEEELIFGFFDLVRELDPDVITGYNILSFDISYMYRRICHMVDLHFNVSRLKGYRGVFRELRWSSSAYGANDFYIPDCFGRILIDAMQYVKRELRFQKFTLANVATQLLGETKADLTPKQVFKCISLDTPDSLAELGKYCLRDSELALRIFNRVNAWYGCIELSRLTDTRLSELYTRGESRKIISQLYRECSEKGILMDSYCGKGSDIKGASVMDPVIGVHDWCVVLDFSSLYPSVVISSNICYTTYERFPTSENTHRIQIDGRTHHFSKTKVGVVPGLLKNLITQRKKYKGTMKNMDQNSSQYLIYDKRQNALKICANAIYGCFGTRSISCLYFPEGAESVTAMGRKYIADAKAFIEDECGQKVLYGDTDSCMVGFGSDCTASECVSLGSEISVKASAEFPEGVSLNVDTVFEKIFLVTKKRYAGIEAETGKCKIKGLVPARSDTCAFIKNINGEVLSSVLDKKTRKDISDDIDRAVVKLKSGGYPISEFQMSTTLKGNYASASHPAAVFKACSELLGRSYVPGAKIEYVVVDTDEALQGYRWRDIEYYDKSECIDYEFYETRLRKSLSGIMSAVPV
jgi:DNA polymerase elongation subunit (family B)